MAVAVDATGTALATTTAGTSVSYTGITVGSGLKRALIFILCFDSSTVTAPTATWDNGGSNQSMTLLKLQAAASGSSGAVAIFGLVNPASGNKTLAASWTGSSESSACGISFTGVNQTGGATSFPNTTGATGNSVTASVTVSSAVGDIVVAGHAMTTSGSITSVNNTQIFIDNAGITTGNSANRAAGAASVTMTSTVDSAGQWASVGTDIHAAGFVAAPRLKTHLRR